MAETSREPWWRGRRGEWYVAAQAALFLLVAVGPRTWSGLPVLALPYPSVAGAIANALLLIGLLLAAAGVASLRSNLSPLPYPRAGGTLVQAGPYKIVRHPMYAGALLAAFGWSVRVRGPLTLIFSVLLFLLLDMKSRREERWLADRFADYPAYQKRVRKLIPFVY